jgi:hypothetical protein
VTLSTPRSARPTPRSARPTACCATPVATRFTRATGDCDRRRGRFRPLLFRAEDFREDLRPPLLRRAEDFRRDDFLPPDLRALLARFLVRFRAPPLLRPEDPDRDLFLPLALDFLAAAMGKLRVGGFVERIARFAHNNARKDSTALRQDLSLSRSDQPRMRVSPCRMIQRSLLSEPDACHSLRMRIGGSSIGSSVSLNVPQWAAATTNRLLP